MMIPREAQLLSHTQQGCIYPHLPLAAMAVDRSRKGAAGTIKCLVACAALVLIAVSVASVLTYGCRDTHRGCPFLNLSAYLARDVACWDGLRHAGTSTRIQPEPPPTVPHGPPACSGYAEGVFTPEGLYVGPRHGDSACVEAGDGGACMRNLRALMRLVDKTISMYGTSRARPPCGTRAHAPSPPPGHAGDTFSQSCTVSRRVIWMSPGLPL